MNTSIRGRRTATATSSHAKAVVMYDPVPLSYLALHLASPELLTDAIHRNRFLRRERLSNLVSPILTLPISAYALHFTETADTKLSPGSMNLPPGSV
jgi:hypothetical protein